MGSDREHRIRERAYALWVEGGHQEGTSEADWLRAEREHTEPSAAPEPAPPATKKAAAPKATKAAASAGPAKGASAKPRAGRSPATTGA